MKDENEEEQRDESKEEIEAQRNALFGGKRLRIASRLPESMRSFFPHQG